MGQIMPAQSGRRPTLDTLFVNARDPLRRLFGTVPSHVNAEHRTGSLPLCAGHEPRSSLSLSLSSN
jgi:hypothetical protein